jgi:hypothetical protein
MTMTSTLNPFPNIDPPADAITVFTWDVVGTPSAFSDFEVGAWQPSDRHVFVQAQSDRLGRPIGYGPIVMFRFRQFGASTGVISHTAITGGTCSTVMFIRFAHSATVTNVSA